MYKGAGYDIRRWGLARGPMTSPVHGWSVINHLCQELISIHTVLYQSNAIHHDN